MPRPDDARARGDLTGALAQEAQELHGRIARDAVTAARRQPPTLRDTLPAHHPVVRPDDWPPHTGGASSGG
jgi:hypothetical protein